MRQKMILLHISQPLRSEERLYGFRTSNVDHSPYIKGVTIETLSEKEIANLQSEADILNAPDIPVQLVSPVNTETYNLSMDSFVEQQWGIAAVGADESPFDGKGVTVGVVDTGIDVSHPGFSGIQLELRDFTGEGVADLNGHGTHCAGTIFGRDVCGIRIGIARGLESAVIAKVLDTTGAGSSSSTLDGLLWCVEKGAKIISMSLGMDYTKIVKDFVANGWPIDLASSHALAAHHKTVCLFDDVGRLLEAQNAIGRGAIIVAAAGNESRCYVDRKYRMWASPPSCARSIISVAALAEARNGVYELAEFSNAGTKVAAPGVDILSAAPGGSLCRMSGTSMAAPHVAGIATLWAQREKMKAKRLNSESLRGRLLGSGRLELIEASTRILVGTGLVGAPRE